MKIEVKILKAFAKAEHGGNPAGIVINAKDLKPHEKQKIAEAVGLSETVFVNQLREKLFDVSFYTPNKEVDLCGHGTIAAFQLLLDEGIISEGHYHQQTKAGLLSVIVTKSNEILMEQSQPKFLDILDERDEIAESLGISVDDLIENLPVQIVTTGLKDLMVGVKSNAILNDLSPFTEKIYKISEKYDVTGYHVFSLEQNEREQANCRNFAPYYAIDEESATGTASGALASYLYHYNQLAAEAFDEIVFYQGEKMGVHSAIKVQLKVDQNKIEKVYVGGKAILDGIRRIEI